ncbi:hypothetical protein [Fontivita pretiosa]|uniref:iron-sulfur cluster-binding protein n=1 Tax=Fontivita pretiosa TaxID=2989684 RepID=UPI003D1655F2
MITPTPDRPPTAHAPLGRMQLDATVVSNVLLCREHYRLVLRVPTFPPTSPGQFIQVCCHDPQLEQQLPPEFDWKPGWRVGTHGSELAGPVALLRRPFSLAGRRDSADGVELQIIHRVVGVGTSWLSQLRVGQQVGILGPLGNCFRLPPADGMGVLIGGGVGIPPMLYLATALRGRAVAFCGVASRELLPLTVVGQADPSGIAPRLCLAEFAAHQIPSIVTTDDGSFGFGGFVTQALERWLDAQTLSGACSPGRITLYACGPEAMMKRVGEIAQARGLGCQLAVERAMACGMGTCQSCCIRVRKPDPAQPPLPGSRWCYRLACTDGPVFEASELLW